MLHFLRPWQVGPGGVVAELKEIRTKLNIPFNGRKGGASHDPAFFCDSLNTLR
jgi:hypothetical protein